jgi:hypothetical protein
MIPPLVLKVRIRSRDGKGFWLWLPFFLVWPFVLVMVFLLLPFVLLADLLLALQGRRLRLLAMLLGVWRVIAALRGTRVQVSGRGQQDSVDVNIF